MKRKVVLKVIDYKLSSSLTYSLLNPPKLSPISKGIDISTKWVELKEFAAIGSKSGLNAAKTLPGINVGFVDAEGQGGDED